MNAFRARLCFGCEHRSQSPHNITKSACSHPEAKNELAYLEASEDARASLPFPRVMNVRLYPGKSVIDPECDFPFAYSALVIDGCDGFKANERACV